MTPKETKQYLMQYRESMERTAEIEQHLHELKAEAIRLRDHEGQSVALDEAVGRYIDACDTAAEELNRLCVLRGEIRGLIDMLPDKRLRSLMHELYINGKKLVRIAADRDQCYEHTCRMHGEALKIAAEILNEKF